MLYLILALAILALTDMQVDHILKIVELFFAAMSEGVKAVWLALGPALIGYLAYRQAMNRKALDANTAVSKQAFDTANGHNEKIVAAVELSEKVLTAMDKTQKVEVMNSQNHPVPVQPSKP